jgi:hypothetical protein
LCKETLFCRTVPANMSTANPTSNLILSENVKIGEIDHLMIDKVGNVRYAVMSFGGFMASATAIIRCLGMPSNRVADGLAAHATPAPPSQHTKSVSLPLQSPLTETIRFCLPPPKGAKRMIHVHEMEMEPRNAAAVIRAASRIHRPPCQAGNLPFHLVLLVGS